MAKKNKPVLIYTSSYGNYKRWPKTHRPICISRWPPTWFRGELNMLLAPSKELLWEMKNGKISVYDYTIRFNQQLAALDPKLIMNDIQNGLLLCYETKKDFCHRHLVADWLNMNGILTEEV